MKKNKNQKISGDEFDQLMNMAFIHLDFSEVKNQMLLDSVSVRALAKTSFSFSGIKKWIFNKLYFFISILLLTGGLLLYLNYSTSREADALVSTKPLTMPAAIRKTLESKKLQVKAPKKRTLIANPLTETRHEIAATIIQEKATITGHVKNSTTGHGIMGAAVYEANSLLGTLSGERGYFSLTLPKGEYTIGVSIQGYQSFNFWVYLDDNISRDVELSFASTLLNEVIVKPNGYVFPNLTEKEKRANEREKQKMAKNAAKLKSGEDLKYSYIPEPADNSFSSFYMGSGEVTNLEYRTFLFDLLINGKKNEFLIAKPEQDLWINAGGVHYFDTLSRIYFSEKRYNSFPVVNISVEGAELYCKWLNDLVNIIRQKENKTMIVVRLPNEKEWLHAANAGHSDAVYPWPSDSIQNRKNWFLANFCIQKLSDKFKYPLGHPNKFDPLAYTSAGIALSGGVTTAHTKVATIETWSYNPNGFYLYNVCGNVSEMVCTSEGKCLKARGGNWNSSFEQLKFNHDNEFDNNVKPSPMIGFRVCLIEKK